MSGADRVGTAGGGPTHLVVATVRRPHGVRGEVVLALDTDRPGAVFRKGRRLRLGDARGRPLDRWITVEKTRPFKDGLLLKAEEFLSRTPELEALRGHSLLIETREAAPADADEFHYRELVGMEVVSGGESVGTVQEVADTPGGELLIVRRPGASDLLLPFVREWVRQVDRAQGRLEIDPPEGLLEL